MTHNRDPTVSFVGICAPDYPHAMNSPHTPLPSMPQPARLHGLLLLVGSCLPILGAVLIAPLLPQMEAHFSTVPMVSVLVPLVLTTPALMIGLLGPLAGALIDRHGRKRPLTCALLAYGVFGTAPLWLDNLHAILASRLGLGLAEAVIITSCTALIGDYYADSARARMLAWQTMTGSMSAALFFAVGGALGEFGWRTPFWLYLAGFVMMPLIALVLWEPSPSHTVTPQSHPQNTAPFPWRALSPVYFLTWCAGVSLFVVAVQLGFLLTGISVHSPKFIGAAIGASHAAVFAGALAARWGGRFRPPSVLCVAFLLSGGSFIVLSEANTYAQVIVAVLFNGFGIGMMIPTLALWALAQLPGELRGRGAGNFMASVYLGQFTSPLVVAGVTAVAHGLRDAIGTLGCASLAIALLCAFAVALHKRRDAAIEIAG